MNLSVENCVNTEFVALQSADTFSYSTKAAPFKDISSSLFFDFSTVVHMCVGVYIFVGCIKYSSVYLLNRFHFQSNLYQNAMGYLVHCKPSKDLQ